MIRNNKPAPYSPSKETIEAVRERDNYKCFYCGEHVPECPPHHWGLHNTKVNRIMYPRLVHHAANLMWICQKCHVLYGNQHKLPLWEADILSELLENEAHISIGKNQDGSPTIYFLEV